MGGFKNFLPVIFLVQIWKECICLFLTIIHCDICMITIIYHLSINRFSTADDYIITIKLNETCQEHSIFNALCHKQRGVRKLLITIVTMIFNCHEIRTIDRTESSYYAISIYTMFSLRGDMRKVVGDHDILSPKKRFSIGKRIKSLTTINQSTTYGECSKSSHIFRKRAKKISILTNSPILIYICNQNHNKLLFLK